MHSIVHGSGQPPTGQWPYISTSAVHGAPCVTAGREREIDAGDQSFIHQGKYYDQI